MRGRAEKCTRFWWEGSKERDDMEDLGVDGRVESKCILVILVGRVWSGFALVRIGTDGGVF
jgi:hypothetical protein